MRHYSTQRPVMPGGFPKPQGNKVLEIHNFDTRQYVDEIGREAWGWIEYESSLSQDDMTQYELAPVSTSMGSLFWRTADPCHALEEIRIGGGMDAGFFLHGCCGVFALALHEQFGYDIMVAAERPDEGTIDSPDAWKSRIVHIYCQKDDAYIDARGVTADKESFFGEFSDFLNEDDDYFTLSAERLKDFVCGEMSEEEFKKLYSASCILIKKYREGYRAGK